MMMGEVVEFLDCRQVLLVKGDAVFICDCWVFESMECGLVVLRVGIIDARGKKGERRVNFRASEVCHPIAASNNTLIDLLSTWKISIYGIKGRNVVYGGTGTIWIHAGNLVGSVN